MQFCAFREEKEWMNFLPSFVMERKAEHLDDLLLDMVMWTWGSSLTSQWNRKWGGERQESSGFEEKGSDVARPSKWVGSKNAQGVAGECLPGHWGAVLGLGSWLLSVCRCSRGLTSWKLQPTGVRTSASHCGSHGLWKVLAAASFLPPKHRSCSLSGLLLASGPRGKGILGNVILSSVKVARVQSSILGFIFHQSYSPLFEIFSVYFLYLLFVFLLV